MNVDVVCLGEVVVDMVAKGKADTPFPEAFFPTPGGAALNVAVALARLGVKSALVGKIGDDVFGRFLKDSLSEEGVDLRGLVLSRKEPTALTFVFREGPALLAPLFVRYGSADMRLEREEVNWEVLREARTVHFVSLCLVREPLRSVTLDILDFCSQKGIFTSFDVNHRPRLWRDSDEAQKLILRVVEMADFLKLTVGELHFLTGCRDLEEGMKVLLSLGVKNCVVTLGEEGAFFANALGGGFVPAFSVATVDPVGCGDAFCAGILKGVVSRKFQKRAPIPVGTLREMVVFASACGALAAQAWGAASSFPLLAKVEKFLQENLLLRNSPFTPPR